MIKCELKDDGIIDVKIKGPAADVNAEFCYLMQAWAEAMERYTSANTQVHIWNACMIALGEKMTELDVYEVSVATNDNYFYVPKQSDGLPRRLWDLLEGGIN